MKKATPGRIAALALKNLFSKPVTVNVKGNEPVISERYRGIIVYAPHDCIGCGICMRDCPTGALSVKNLGTKENRLMRAELDTGRCIFCCQCVDSCPKKCLSSSPDFNLNKTSRDGLKVLLGQTPEETADDT